MKKLICTILLFAISQFCTAQAKFDEAYFRQFIDSYIKNPVEVLKTSSLPEFSFIAGNGNKYNRDKTIAVYNYVSEGKRDFPELTVNQYGTSAIVSGTMIHTLVAKKSQVEEIKKQLFTYVFVQSDGKWNIAIAQHTNLTLSLTEVENK